MNKQFKLLVESVELMEEGYFFDKIKSLFGKGSRKHAVNTQSVKDQFPTGFGEKFRNFFGVYTKYPYKDCVRIFDNMYNNMSKIFKTIINKNKKSMLKEFKSEYILTDKQIKILEKYVVDEFYHAHLAEFVRSVAEKTINHCEDEKKMDKYLEKLYMKHLEEFKKAHSTIDLKLSEWVAINIKLDDLF